MRYLLLSLIFMSCTVVAREGEPPKSLSQNIQFKSAQVTKELPAVDVEQLLQKYQYQPQAAKPLRFAVPNEINTDPVNSGQWIILHDGPYAGDRVWQMRVTAKNATDMNFGLTEFNLPEGVEVHFISYADSPPFYDGPYTSE